MGELERCPRVVVEPPDECRRLRPTNPENPQRVPHRGVVLGACAAQVIDHERRSTKKRLDIRSLVVEDAHRINLGARPRGLVEVEFGEERLQGPSIVGTASGTSK